MPEHEGQVVVIGAGLAGLTAAATAARAGRRVTVVEAHTEGGRARTDDRSGYRFNQGPHALYRSGPAWRILRTLGVAHHGHQPPLRGARLTRDGQVVRLPGRHLATLSARIVTASPAGWAGRPAAEWAAGLGGGGLSELARTLIRVSSYVADLDRLPADLALAQLKAGLRGVSYIDGGWATLVDGLAAAATAAGATVVDHCGATAIAGAPGGWEVALSDGRDLPAAAVVVAAGGPDTVRALLPVDPGWPELGPPVTAACLDLGLRDARPGLLLGLDEPLYLSRHCPPGDLAPDGGSVVHVLRYGAREARLDRAELRRHTGRAGITEAQIVEERFLARMVVTHVLPPTAGGLAARPAIDVPGAPGIYLAGDWVGPTGWLADAALSSGEQAGRRAAQVPVRPPAYPRVA